MGQPAASSSLEIFHTPGSTTNIRTQRNGSKKSRQLANATRLTSARSQVIMTMMSTRSPTRPNGLCPVSRRHSGAGAGQSRRNSTRWRRVESILTKAGDVPGICEYLCQTGTQTFGCRSMFRSWAALDGPNGISLLSVRFHSDDDQANFESLARVEALPTTGTHRMRFMYSLIEDRENFRREISPATEDSTTAFALAKRDAFTHCRCCNCRPYRAAIKIGYTGHSGDSKTHKKSKRYGMGGYWKGRKFQDLRRE